MQALCISPRILQFVKNRGLWECEHTSLRIDGSAVIARPSIAGLDEFRTGSPLLLAEVDLAILGLPDDEGRREVDSRSWHYGVDGRSFCIEFILRVSLRHL
jgi:hypothetical protein